MPKPSLSKLLANQAAAGGRKRRKRSAPTQQPAPLSQPPVPGPIIDQQRQRPVEMTRALLIRRFATAFLGEGMSAAAALRSIRPKLTVRHSKEMAYRLLQADDTKAELLRQAQSFRQRADVDEQWVHRELLSMATCDIRDYAKVDTAGTVTEFMLDKLTPEQARNIRSLRIDPKTRKVTHIALVDRQAAVDSIAKVLRMFSAVDDTDLKNLVADITERMQAASKRVRTFDHATGEEIE